MYFPIVHQGPLGQSLINLYEMSAMSVRMPSNEKHVRRTSTQFKRCPLMIFLHSREETEGVACFTTDVEHGNDNQVGVTVLCPR